MSYFSTRVLVTGVSPLVISAKSKVALLCRRRNVTTVGSFPSISPSLNLSVSARVRAAEKLSFFRLSQSLGV